MIEVLSSVFAQRGDAPRAARLLGTAEALRDPQGMPLRAPDAELLESYVAGARELISAQAWEEQRQAGRARNVQEALADAGASN